MQGQPSRWRQQHNRKHAGIRVENGTRSRRRIVRGRLPLNAYLCIGSKRKREVGRNAKSGGAGKAKTFLRGRISNHLTQLEGKYNRKEGGGGEGKGYENWGPHQCLRVDSPEYIYIVSLSRGGGAGKLGQPKIAKRKN